MILVTGGTGLVGSHLLYHLIMNGEKVRAIHRNTSNLGEVKKVFSYYTPDAEKLYNKIEWIEADILDMPSLTDAFAEVTYVYHVAAYISFSPKKYTLLKRINVEGTANIVNLSLSHGIKKLCHVSSIATIGNNNNGKPNDEESEFDPLEHNNVYSITKRNAELEIWRGAQEGLDTVMVNPAVIFGSGHWDSASGKIIKMISKGIPYYTSGNLRIVDVQDVVNAMIMLMNSQVVNQNYILFSENITYKELLSQMSPLLGKEPPKKEMPKWKLMLLSDLDWISNKLFGTRRKLPKNMLNTLYTTSYYDASKIEKELNFKFTPYKETLQRVAKDYLMES